MAIRELLPHGLQDPTSKIRSSVVGTLFYFQLIILSMRMLLLESVNYFGSLLPFCLLVKSDTIT